MIRVLGAALCLAVLTSACASGGGGGPAGGDGQGGPQLDGRTFLSTEVTENGAPRQLVDGTRIRLRFEAGRLNADAGCNQLSGEYTVDGTALVVGQLAMTEMACMPSARAEQDTWFAELLGSRPTVTLSGDTLVLTGGSSEVTLLDRAGRRPRSRTGRTALAGRVNRQGRRGELYARRDRGSLHVHRRWPRERQHRLQPVQRSVCTRRRTRLPSARWR